MPVPKDLHTGDAGDAFADRDRLLTVEHRYSKHRELCGLQLSLLEDGRCLLTRIGSGLDPGAPEQSTCANDFTALWGLVPPDEQRLLPITEHDLTACQPLLHLATHDQLSDASLAAALKSAIEILRGRSTEVLGYGARPKIPPVLTSRCRRNLLLTIGRELLEGNRPLALGMSMDVLSSIQGAPAAGVSSAPGQRQGSPKMALILDPNPSLAELPTLDEQSQTSAWSEGAIASTLISNLRLGRPEAGGLESEVVFGPTDPGRCACGRLRNAEHLGRRCERCHVECGSPSSRDRRWGHFCLPSPGVAHPSLITWLSSVTPFPRQTIETLIQGRAYLGPDDTVIEQPEGVAEEGLTGMAGLRRLVEIANAQVSRKRRLPPGLGFVHVIPVMPPGDRAPTAHLEFPWAFERPVWGCSEITRAYQELLQRSQRLARLQELKAPSLLVHLQAGQLQAAFEALLNATQRSAFKPSAAAQSLTASTSLELSQKEREHWLHSSKEESPWSAVWVDEATLVVTTATEILVVADRSMAYRMPNPGLRATLASERYVLLQWTALELCQLDGQVLGLRVFDCETRTLSSSVPGGLPLLVEADVDNEAVAITDLRDNRRALVCLEHGCDRIDAISRDGQYLLMGESDVVSVRSLSPEMKLEERQSSSSRWWLRADGSLAQDEAEPDEDSEGPEAVGRTARGLWRIVTACGEYDGLYANSFCIGFDWRAAAISPSGDHVAVVSESAIHLIDCREETPKSLGQIELL